MQNPRVRPLEMFPAEVEGQRVFCLRDPSGLTQQVAMLPPAAALLVALCDGSRTIAEVAAELSRYAGAAVPEDVVAKLVDQLDEGLFLDSPRLERHRQALLDEFRATNSRAAVHAGLSYPAAADEVRALLEGFAGGLDGEPDVLPAPAAGAPVGLIAPHIDFHRGGPAYAIAYRALPRGADRPDLVVVFGTDHNGGRAAFTLTRKTYETPLGPVETDVELVDALVGALPGVDLFADEFHHRSEHSIEFQALWLRHVYGEETPRVLPVLCGSLHASVDGGRSPLATPAIRDFLEALRRLTAGRRVLVVAGADLAHVGPRFGDEPQGEEQRRSVEEADQSALAAALAGDAEGFFSSVAADKDRRRVCGLPPIFATLAFLNGSRRGALLAYDQCPADEEGTSFVSIAAARL